MRWKSSEMSRLSGVLRGSAVLGFSAMALLTSAPAARASSIVLNGSFEDVGPATSSFSIDHLTALPDWSSTSVSSNNLDCLMYAGDTTSLCGAAFGGGFSFWVNPGPSPDGGNFVGIDGDSNFSTPLTQTLNGLVIGTQYDVFFYQAAAQQNGFNGTTTEQWQVSLGSDDQLSTLMNNANHGAVDWMSQTKTFTATATSEVLRFLAIGTPSGVPPFVLLDGVSVNASATATPEPGTYALIGLGLLSIPFARRLLKKRA